MAQMTAVAGRDGTAGPAARLPLYSRAMTTTDIALAERRLSLTAVLTSAVAAGISIGMTPPPVALAMVAWDPNGLILLLAGNAAFLAAALRWRERAAGEADIEAEFEGDAEAEASD